MRTAEQVVNDINSARGDGDEQGLRNTAALLEILKAWPVCPVIHVAGTNGKGTFISPCMLQIPVIYLHSEIIRFF